MRREVAAIFILPSEMNYDIRHGELVQLDTI